MVSSKKNLRAFCRRFIGSMDLHRAAAESGITDAEALDILGSPEAETELERCRDLLSKQLRADDAVRRMAELAFGEANDCVKLVMEEGCDIGGLDLSLLAELKRGSNGVVEIKLLDRVKVLDRLLELLGGTGGQAEAFLSALNEAGDEV